MIHDELAIIRTISSVLGKPSRRIRVGIGDDAAIADSPLGKLVATVDTMVENVHFDLAYMTPKELGARALSVSVSDIAAMGATPLYALVSVGLRQEAGELFVEELARGIRMKARQYRIDVIGGNTVQSPNQFTVEVTVIGEGKRFTLRDGARRGDLIVATGFLGSSAAGLNLLKRLGRHNVPPRFKELVFHHLDPQARVSLALRLNPYVHAAIDLSDGLSSDLHHLCHASKVGARIFAASIPISSACHEAAKFLDTQADRWALCGGEDYELLLAIPRHRFPKCQKLAGKNSLHVIGEFCDRRRGVSIERDGKTSKLSPMGWNHFVRRGRLKSDP